MRSTTSSKRASWRRRRIAVLVAAAVLFTALIGSGIALLTAGAAHVVQQAGAAVGSWGGVRYQGTVTDSGGLDTELDLTVAANGNAHGELQRPFGASAEIGFDGASTMIRGNREWWMSYEPAAASGRADRWIMNPPASMTGVDAMDLLTPTSLGRALAPPGDEPWTRAGERDIGGLHGQAWSDGSRHVVVRADGAPQVLAVDVPLVENPYSLVLPVDHPTQDRAGRDEHTHGLWEAQVEATVTAPTNVELEELENLLGEFEDLAGTLEEAIQAVQEGAVSDGRPAEECRPRDEVERAPDGDASRPAEPPGPAAPSIPTPSLPRRPPTPPPPPPGPDGVAGEGVAGSADSGPLPDPTGGVDFSALELRYVRDNDTGDGIEYAFSASPNADGGIDGARPAGTRQASDAFFVWLALPPSSFWVNLNWDEPERIIDPQLARTDAGRILLEADLAMKKVSARLLHPDTDTGKRYWDSIELYNDAFCSSTRYWIVPGPATVAEENGGLYIINAPLRVRSESMASMDSGIELSGPCADAPRSTVEHNESLERDLIRPQIERTVNESPEFAELRQVYLSRVAAEWYRKRQGLPTPVDGLIDGENVNPWVSRVAWSPNDVFDRYVESIQNFEFDVVREERDGDTVLQSRYTVGGVDWTRVVFHELDPGEIEKLRPGLASVVAASFERPTTDTGGNVWRGSAGELPLAWRGSGWWAWPYVAVPVFVAVVVLALPTWMLRRRRASIRAGESAS